MGAAGPVKRSVMIAGHATSISLEPVFWDALREAAAAAGLPLNALVARIDTARVAEADPPNLASAIRVWLFEQARGSAPRPPGEGGGAAGTGA
jgi:predicted DNA-binding ribbon-helix-helix protein